MLFNLPIDNGQRIALRRLLREQRDASRAVVVAHVEVKNFAAAESLVEDIRVLEKILDNLRALEALPEAVQ